MNDAKNLISRAEHCLNTSQPNLAALYMKNAIDILEAERPRSLNSYPELTIIRTARGIKGLTDQFRAIGEAVSGVFQAFAEAFRSTEELRKSDFSKMA